MREKIHFYLGLYPKAVLLLNKINTLYTKILRFGSRQEEDIDKIYMGLHEDAILKIILFLPPNLEDSTGLSCNYFKTLPIYRYMYLETDIYIKRYIYRLYKLEQHHIWLKEWEQKVRVLFPSSVDSHGLPWHGVGSQHQTPKRSFLEKLLLYLTQTH